MIELAEKICERIRSEKHYAEQQNNSFPHAQPRFTIQKHPNLENSTLLTLRIGNLKFEVWTSTDPRHWIRFRKRKQKVRPDEIPQAIISNIQESIFQRKPT